MTHAAVPVVGHEGVVPKVCRLECTPNDLTDGDDTGQFVFACTDPVSSYPQSRKIALERRLYGVALTGLDEGHGSSQLPGNSARRLLDGASRM
jgi:hypothetical protein